jgi:hypothetical protein
MLQYVPLNVQKLGRYLMISLKNVAGNEDEKTGASG